MNVTLQQKVYGKKLKKINTNKYDSQRMDIQYLKSNSKLKLDYKDRITNEGRHKEVTDMFSEKTDE